MEEELFVITFSATLQYFKHDTEEASKNNQCQTYEGREKMLKRVDKSKSSKVVKRSEVE
jgi:hypothetical protein